MLCYEALGKKCSLPALFGTLAAIVPFGDAGEIATERQGHEAH
jgi:hypothetical protein